MKNDKQIVVYIGLDVHKESISACAMERGDKNPAHHASLGSGYEPIVKFTNTLKEIYGDDAHFVCGYEAGCLGFTLYRDLMNHGVDCVVMAPTTIPLSVDSKKKKNDRRDSESIAKALAYNTFSQVEPPTEEDEAVRDYIRMRSDTVDAAKKIKQRILGFLLRKGLTYSDGKSNWTVKHFEWMKKLKFKEAVDQETLECYLAQLRDHLDWIARYDAKIEAFAKQERYKEPVSRFKCLLGVDTLVALSVVVEIGDFRRFARPQDFAAYLGLVPSENSSGAKIQTGGITKAGNRHIRKLLIEAAQQYVRGVPGYKGKKLKKRQEGVSEMIIAYADKASTRLRRRVQRLIFQGKSHNVAKTAGARELACFLWGLATDNIA